MGQAKVTLAGAGELALKEHPGSLAGIGFNDENGRGVYEARVPGALGQTWIIKLDAETSETLAMGDTVLIGDGEQEVADIGSLGDNHADGELPETRGKGGDEGDEGGMTEATNG